MPRRKRLKEPLSIKSVLENSLKRLKLSSRIEDYQNLKVWEEVVGKRIARQAQPENLQKGRLLVKVSSPPWMQQLQFMKEDIRQRLNKKIGSELIQEIYFKIGEIHPPTFHPEEPSQVDWSKIFLGEKEREKIEKNLGFISDPALKEVVRKLMLKQRKYQEFLEKEKKLKEL